MKNIDLFSNYDDGSILNLNKEPAYGPIPQTWVPKKMSIKIEDKEYGYLTGSCEFHENEPWVQTYSGRRFNPLNPIPETIVIQDVAHALSNMCRYNGQCNSFYSVAQHSVIVSYLCDQKDALYGLLHDLSEAYIADISSPVKRTPEFEGYRNIERNLMCAVYKRFGLYPQEPVSVKQADYLALATEANCLLNARSDWKLDIEPAPFKIDPLPPKEAKMLFINRFFDLIGKPELKIKYNSSLDKMNNEEIIECLKKK